MRAFGMGFHAKLFSVVFPAVLCVLVAFAQTEGPVASEYAEDGTPVIIKNLPGPDAVRARAVWARSLEDIRSVVGPRAIIDSIELARGVEAAAAVYPEGNVLLVEYPTPQLSVDADARFLERMAALPPMENTRYRRIGNYSAFVFDARDEVSADALLDQIKYSKTVQWLGEDPNYQMKVERYLAVSTANVFIGTLFAIVTGAAVAIAVGIAVGLVYFRMEDRRRMRRETFSDAGGMTRLNLDDLSEPLTVEKD